MGRDKCEKPAKEKLDSAKKWKMPKDDFVSGEKAFKFFVSARVDERINLFFIFLKDYSIWGGERKSHVSIVDIFKIKKTTTDVMVLFEYILG